MRFIIGLCILLPAMVLGAGPETLSQIRRLESAISYANQEQQSLHQQFQMVLEISKAQAQQYSTSVPQAGVAAPPGKYDDIVRARQEADARVKQNIDELNWLYARFREVESEKQRLRDQLNQLLDEQ